MTTLFNRDKGKTESDAFMVPPGWPVVPVGLRDAFLAVSDAEIDQDLRYATSKVFGAWQADPHHEPLLARHLARLDLAQRKAPAQRAAAASEAYVATLGCEICGRLVGHRTTTLPGMAAAVRVCELHEPVLRARSARWVAEQELAPGKTVAAAIDALFESTKGTKS